jgi:23S rRNA (guanosine2251-2'-O)-methyltransferase
LNRKLKNDELERKSVSEFKNAEKTPVVIVLDNVRSALNVGSIFRTADAFLIEAIYLCGITAQPPNRDIQKTALGATETIAWKYFGNTKDAVTGLKSNNYKIIAAEQTSSSILLDKYIPQPNEKIAIVFGNEISGIDQEIINSADHAIEIPQAGMKHSLNIAVCVGIVVWEIYRKLRV